ncbi:hypothetical protein [Xanthobacter aminoxidans]|uniref:hypothetical protein n=1 Tax=Xanthobacter aminoxidans TaxID=186280 RepID=UPI002022F34A|nr:hypothetical protein [Xanthobacter aminoxidans]MCL8385556.1 hypothetical protein [Xanthobacter aminoxidans]
MKKRAWVCITPEVLLDVLAIFAKSGIEVIGSRDTGFIRGPYVALVVEGDAVPFDDMPGQLLPEWRPTFRQEEFHGQRVTVLVP